MGILHGDKEGGRQGKITSKRERTAKTKENLKSKEGVVDRQQNKTETKRGKEEEKEKVTILGILCYDKLVFKFC